MDDKKRREQDEQSNVNAQATMWNVDKANWDVEEQRLKDRINRINKENQDFLLAQMQEKQSKAAKMNSNEFAFNKALLREVNQKMKTASVKASSQASKGPLSVNGSQMNAY